MTQCIYILSYNIRRYLDFNDNEILNYVKTTKLTALKSVKRCFLIYMLQKE